METNELSRITSRRHFLATVLGSLALPTTSPAQEDIELAGLPVLEYGRCYICNSAPANAVRFCIESRTSIAINGKTVYFYQCGSCKSERTFAPERLFYEENYDFLPVLGGESWIIFRRHAVTHPDYQEVAPVTTKWGRPRLSLSNAKGVRRLTDWSDIRDETARGSPIVGRTVFDDTLSGARVTMEYPVKTMNISIEHALYQVDTGPLVYPDFSINPDSLPHCLRLAFVAFNRSDRADFVIEQPVPVATAAGSEISVHHYTKPFSLATTNILFRTA